MGVVISATILIFLVGLFVVGLALVWASVGAYLWTTVGYWILGAAGKRAAQIKELRRGTHLR